MKLLRIIYYEAAFAVVTQYKVRKIIKVRNMSKKKSLEQEGNDWSLMKALH